MSTARDCEFQYILSSSELTFSSRGVNHVSGVGVGLVLLAVAHVDHQGMKRHERDERVPTLLLGDEVTFEWNSLVRVRLLIPTRRGKIIIWMRDFHGIANGSASIVRIRLSGSRATGDEFPERATDCSSTIWTDTGNLDVDLYPSSSLKQLLNS